jgi:hypothetical protein
MTARMKVVQEIDRDVSPIVLFPASKSRRSEGKVFQNEAIEVHSAGQRSA